VSGNGGVVAAIRRVPHVVLWAALSTLWVGFVRIDDPNAKAFEYAPIPIYLGVTLIAARVLPREHLAWLPPSIGLLVTIPMVLALKALS
jgi:hypothetical protein